MTNQTPAARVAAFLEAWTANVGTLDDTPLLSATTSHRRWAHLTPGDLRELLAIHDKQAQLLDVAGRQLAAPPVAWWLDTGDFDYDPPKLYATEQAARDAAVKHWKHFNYPREVEFTWAPEPNDDPDEPDPGRGFELVAGGHKTGHFVRPVPVQGAEALLRITQESIDLIRNTVGVWYDNAAGFGCALPHSHGWYRARIADFEQLLALISPAEPGPLESVLTEAPADPEPAPTPPWLIEAGDD